MELRYFALVLGYDTEKDAPGPEARWFNAELRQFHTGFTPACLFPGSTAAKAARAKLPIEERAGVMLVSVVLRVGRRSRFVEVTEH